MEIKTIPLVKGDGVGPEVTASMVAIIDAAVEKAYGEQRRIGISYRYKGSFDDSCRRRNTFAQCGSASGT